MSRMLIGSASCVMVRRDALERVGGFNEKLRVADDILMWLNLAHAGMKFGHIPQPLVEYRFHDGNLHRDPLKGFNDFAQVYEEFLAANDLSRRVRKQARVQCARWHLLAAIEELKAGNKRHSRGHVLRAARVQLRSIRPGWIRILGIGPRPV
jgi:hypothetical protein